MTVVATRNDADQLAWLSIAFGDDEARKAMRLPPDLREELYGDVFHFGPTYEQLLACVGAAKLQAGDAWLESQFEQLRETSIDTNFLRQEYVVGLMEAAGHSLPGGFTFADWKEVAGYGHLDDNLTRLSWGFTHRSGLRILLWMVTGQHLFPAGLINMDSRYVSTADGILSYLGLPALRYDAQKESV